VILAALVMQAATPPPPSIQVDRLFRDPPLIMDAGNLPCGTWTARRREDGRAREADIAWTMGFVTGAEVRGIEMGAPAIVRSYATVVPFLDSYCEGNPASKVMEGAKALSKHLAQEAARPR
jgi:hypothetical protein